jgi:hypothetical protein
MGLYESYNDRDHIAASNYNLHTQLIFIIDPGTKIIYFSTAMFTPSLAVTGLMIWLNERK